MSTARNKKSHGPNAAPWFCEAALGLTAFGRQFKLRGYTLGRGRDDKPIPYDLPLAMGAQVANTVIVQQMAFHYGGKIAELDWPPLPNEQNLKVGLRYTAYTRFNGASHNYDGFRRSASGYNSLFAYL